MGSNETTVNFYDNSEGLPSQEAIALIKKYILSELPSFRVVREYDDAHGYWGIFFADDRATILIGSERGFIDYSIEIGENKVALSDFDERIAVLEKTSEKNFCFLVDAIKRYLSSNQQ